MMRFPTALASLAFVAGCASSGDVKTSRPRPEPSKEMKEARVKDNNGLPVKLGLDELTAGAPKAPRQLTVTSPAFAKNAPIPATYSDYGEKSSPPLRIGDVPADARSLVVIVDDPDAAEPKPFVHWVIYNLPPNALELRTAVPPTGQVRQLMNAKQGPNSRGSTGYFGPRPPVGDPPHHYHVQVFALDAMLPLEQGAKKSEVIAAARGHVLAAGELVGTFAKAK